MVDEKNDFPEELENFLRDVEYYVNSSNNTTNDDKYVAIYVYRFSYEWMRRTAYVADNKLLTLDEYFNTFKLYAEKIKQHQQVDFETLSSIYNSLNTLNWYFGMTGDLRRIERHVYNTKSLRDKAEAILEKLNFTRVNKGTLCWKNKRHPYPPKYFLPKDVASVFFTNPDLATTFSDFKIYKNFVNDKQLGKIFENSAQIFNTEKNMESTKVYNTEKPEEETAVFLKTKKAKRTKAKRVQKAPKDNNDIPENDKPENEMRNVILSDGALLDKFIKHPTLGPIIKSHITSDTDIFLLGGENISWDKRTQLKESADANLRRLNSQDCSTPKEQIKLRKELVYYLANVFITMNKNYKDDASQNVLKTFKARLDKTISGITGFKNELNDNGIKL